MLPRAPGRTAANSACDGQLALQSTPCDGTSGSGRIGSPRRPDPGRGEHVRLGATLAHLSDAPPFAIARWADRLVTAGFESLWTPHIIGRGALIPDPFVTLATAATATQ